MKDIGYKFVCFLTDVKFKTRNVTVIQFKTRNVTVKLLIICVVFELAYQ